MITFRHTFAEYGSPPMSHRYRSVVLTQRVSGPWSIIDFMADIEKEGTQGQQGNRLVQNGVPLSDRLRLGRVVRQEHDLVEDSKIIGIYTTLVFDKAAYCHLFFRPKRAGCADIAHQTVHHSIGVFPSVFPQFDLRQEFEFGGCGVGIEGPAFQAFGLIEFGLKPGPKGPGWQNGWPGWAGRRRHPPYVKSSSSDWLHPVKPGV